MSLKENDSVIVLVNGTSFITHTHAHIQIFTENGSLIESAANTASPIDLINQISLTQHFPSIQIQQRKDGLQVGLTSVSSGLTISNFIEMPIACQTMSGKKTLQFPVYRFYLVPKIPGGILLGLDFFAENKLDFRWGTNGKSHCLQLADTDDCVLLQTNRSQREPKVISRRINIYLLQTTVVLPRTGINLPVTHRLLPPQRDDYVVSPRPQIDIFIEKLGSVVNAITSGTPQPLPFANFGKAPIRLRQGTVLSVLKEGPK